MTARIPQTLRYEGQSARVLTLGDGRFAFAFYEGSKRRVVKRWTLEELRAEWERVAKAIVNAETAALALGAAEARVFVVARDLLAPHGLELDAAARIVDEAARLLGDPQRIVEAARWFSRTNAHAASSLVRVPDVVQEFLRSRVTADLSAVYVKKLEDDLGRFAAAFPVALSTVRAAQIAGWIAPPVEVEKQALGARRRRNLRDKVITLFNWCRDQGYLPESMKHEAEKVARPKIRRGEVAIYTPAEMRVLLEHAKAVEMPALVIAAFAGLRSAEIMRLEWRDVRFDQGVIRLPASKSKTNEPRAVPMRENLRAWLRPYEGKAGWIVPRVQTGGQKTAEPKRLDHLFRALAMRSGVQTRRNALRHSFGTYFCASCKNVPEVAFEMGNSPAVVKRNYFEAVSEAEAKRWFGLLPHDLANVLPLRFARPA